MPTNCGEGNDFISSIRGENALILDQAHRAKRRFARHFFEIVAAMKLEMVSRFGSPID